MEKYVCTVCGYIYDEAEGCPDSGVAAGTVWSDVPDDFPSLLMVLIFLIYPNSR